MSNKNKSSTPKQLEGRARAAEAIATYVDSTESTNKKFIPDDVRQKVNTIYSVFEGSWKKEDILRSLEDNNGDIQATIDAKLAGKEDWKDVKSKRKPEPAKKKPSTPKDNSEEGGQSNRGRGGFRGGRGSGRGGFRGGRGGRGASRGGKYTSNSYQSNYKSDQQQDQEDNTTQVAPEVVAQPARPTYSEIAKRVKEQEEQKKAAALQEQQQQTPVAEVTEQEPIEQPVIEKPKKQRNKRERQAVVTEQPAQPIQPVEEQQPEPVQQPKQKKLKQKYVPAPAPAPIVTEAQDTQAAEPEPEEPEVVIPSNKYAIDVKFGAFGDNQAEAPAEQQPTAPAIAPAQEQPSNNQYANYGWNQQSQPSQPAAEPQQPSALYNEIPEQPQIPQGDAPTTKQGQQNFKGYPPSNFLPSQYHQYGYPYHPYMMNFQYQTGYPNPSKPYPYYGQKNAYNYPYGQQPSTAVPAQGYPYPAETEGAPQPEYGKYPYYIPQQPPQGYDVKQSRGPQQGGQPKDKRGQQDEYAYNYMPHYPAYAYPNPYQQYPPQQHMRGAPQQKGDWNPSYNQTQ